MMRAIYILAICVPLYILARRAWTRYRWWREPPIPRSLPFATYVLSRVDWCWHRSAGAFASGMRTRCGDFITRPRIAAVKNTHGGWDAVSYRRDGGISFPCPRCVEVERKACSGRS